MENDGIYCIELKYKITGNDLEQKNIKVIVDDREPIYIMAIVTGKSEKQRTKISLKKNSRISFDDDVEEFSLYKL